MSTTSTERKNSYLVYVFIIIVCLAARQMIHKQYSNRLRFDHISAHVSSHIDNSLTNQLLLCCVCFGS